MLIQLSSPHAVTNTHMCRTTILACESTQALQEAVCPAGKQSSFFWSYSE